MTRVGSVQRTRRVSVAPARTDPVVRSHAGAAPVEPVDDSSQQPVAPRPAWPDRQPPQLEAVARRRAAFARATVLGNRLDKTA